MNCYGVLETAGAPAVNKEPAGGYSSYLRVIIRQPADLGMGRGRELRGSQFLWDGGGGRGLFTPEVG